MAADMETNLLYFSCANDDKIIVGNEEGKILYHFLCAEPFDDIVVSHNIMVTSGVGGLRFYNKDGKQITRVENERILGDDICLVHDKGIFVVYNKYQSRIHLWRVV
jgi:hypothetical protein